MTLNCFSKTFTIPDVRIDGEKVRDAFFTRGETDLTKWVCRCGKTRTVKCTEYSNCLSHVQASHDETLAEFLRTEGSTEFSSSSRKSNLGKNLFFTNKTVQLHGIIDFVVAGLFPFSIVSNSKVIRHLKYDRIDVKTLKKYLKLVTEIVERKIAKSLPNQIAVAFDGWPAGSDHYVSVFAIYDSESQKGFDIVLIAFLTFEDGESQSAESHNDFLNFVLDIFGKDISNVVALIADNCSTNRLTERNCDKPL